MAGNYDIVVEQGATFSLLITWKDEDAAAVDLTSYSAAMQIRHLKSSSSIISDLSTAANNAKIVLGGSAGTITITIPASETTTFTKTRAVYDLTLTSGTGVVTRLLEGRAEISESVTS